MDADGNGQLDESTEPFTPTFTGEFSALPTAEPVLIEGGAAAGRLRCRTTDQYLKRWTFVLVVAGVWIVAAAIGLGPLLLVVPLASTRRRRSSCVLVYLVVVHRRQPARGDGAGQAADVGAGDRADVGAVRVDGRRGGAVRRLLLRSR